MGYILDIHQAQERGNRIAELAKTPLSPRTKNIGPNPICPMCRFSKNTVAPIPTSVEIRGNPHPTYSHLNGQQGMPRNGLSRRSRPPAPSRFHWSHS